MIEVLNDEYVPEKLLHREEKIKELTKVFDNFNKVKMASNTIIIGVSGSGKTSIIKHVIRDKENFIFVSGNKTKTHVKTLKAIANSSKNYNGDVLDDVLEQLAENRRIIIIDEIHKISNLTKLFDDLNTIYRKTMVPIILLTCDRDIEKKMAQDAKLTLFFDKITLPSYNALEIQDILKDRINLLNIQINLPDSFVPYVSAVAARKGSCRAALQLLVRCLQSGNFTQKFIEDENDKLDKKEWESLYNDLNETEKRLLIILLRYAYHNENQELTITEIQKMLAYEEGIKLTISMVSKMIDSFQEYGALSFRYKNMGRAGGRTRYVKFKTQETFEEISKSVPDYEITC